MLKNIYLKNKSAPAECVRACVCVHFWVYKLRVVRKKGKTRQNKVWTAGTGWATFTCKSET